MSPLNGRIETKVYGAVVGTALGGALATFLVWLGGVTIWHASFTAAAADEALRAVPYPVSGLLLAVLGLSGTALGGYSAPRTTDAERSTAGAVEAVAPADPAPDGDTATFRDLKLRPSIIRNDLAQPTADPQPD